MKRILVLAVTAIALAGCMQTVADRRTTTGAIIGGTTGAIVGGVATNTVGGVLAGGAIGAVTGGVLAAATAPHACYVRTRHGRVRRVRC